MAKYKLYRYPLYGLARAASFVIEQLPRPVALNLGALGGRIAFAAVKRHREKTLRHLQEAFPEKSEKELRELAKSVFENLATMAVEVLRFHRLNESNINRIIDYGNSLEVYKEVLSRGKGAICLTAHLGNWELMGGALCLKGVPGTAIARKIYFKPYNEWIVGLRKSVKVKTLYREDSTRTIFELLKRNEIVGMLPDQDIDSVSGVFVPFFGKLAYTPTSPAKISLLTGAPLVPTFLIREKGNRYRFVMGEGIYPDQKKDKDREREVEILTHRWMKSVENVIRLYPEQWAWMHDRWKTQPTSTTVGATRRVAPTSIQRVVA